jgi:hypothetical protein
MKLLRHALALAVFAVPLSSGASLIGDTVTCTEIGPGSFECAPPAAVVVDPGSEFFLGNPGNTTLGFNINVGAFDILLTAIGSFGLGATIVDFSSLDAGGPITGVTLSVSAGVSGVSQSDITFDPDSVVLDLRGTDFDSQSTVTLTLTIGQAQVPEPGTLGLLALAAATLIGLCTGRLPDATRAHPVLGWNRRKRAG